MQSCFLGNPRSVSVTRGNTDILPSCPQATGSVRAVHTHSHCLRLSQTFLCFYLGNMILPFRDENMGSDSQNGWIPVQTCLGCWERWITEALPAPASNEVFYNSLSLPLLDCWEQWAPWALESRDLSRGQPSPFISLNLGL